MTVLATAANAIFCFVIAYLIVLTRAPGRGAAWGGVSRALRAIPPTAIALGLAATFDRNAMSSLRVLLVGTYWILPLAYFIRNIPLVTNVEGPSCKWILAPDAARGLVGGLAARCRVVLFSHETGARGLNDCQ